MTAAPSRARRFRAPVLLGVAWVITRALLLLIHEREREIDGDLQYFFASLGQSDIRITLREYPAPVVWLLQPLRQLADGDNSAFATMFVAAMLAVDAAFTAYLVRQGRPSGDYVGALGWLALGLCVGPLMLFRFDLVPGVLAALAIGWVGRGPARAGLAAALGFAVKLWPIALVPLLIGRGWRRLAVSAAVGAFVIVELCLLFAGPARTVSPLTWQRERGLQIESVTATPLMLARLSDPLRWRIEFLHNAYEINGPWTAVAEHVATVLVVLAALLVIVLWWRVIRSGRADPQLAGLLCLIAICLMIVSNKTFSPQYVLWVAPGAAVLLARDPRDRSTRLLMLALCVTALLTQQLYPAHYEGLLTTPPGAGAVCLLLVRNLLLVAVTAGLIATLLRRLRVGPGDTP